MNQTSEDQYNQATIVTANNLKTVAETLMAKNISKVSLPELEQAIEIISKMVPAGNVPGVVLNGLSRLAGRQLPEKNVKRDINALFRGVEQLIDRTAFGAFFAGPAAIIWGYQNLLKLAGKTPEDAFPDGTWQFYVDYALRDDTARHTNETHGFDTHLKHQHIRLNQVDRITAWVMATMTIVDNYNQLLENEWRERIYINHLNTITNNQFPDLYRQWEKKRPYGRPDDTSQYIAYRKATFDKFIETAMREVNPSVTSKWHTEIQELESQQLVDFQEQMTIHARLEASSYNETHHLLSLRAVQIGVIYRGGYYLLPIYQLGTQRIADMSAIRAQVAAILNGLIQVEPADLATLARVKRSALSNLISKFSSQTQSALDKLQSVPILLNFDGNNANNPLTQIRQTERGIGSHALTVIDTGSTFVFDQSHIFFDGTWGAALAEIMTQEAIYWGRKLGTEPQPVLKAYAGGITALRFYWKPEDKHRIQLSPQSSSASSVENKATDLKQMMRLRQLLKQRNEMLSLTVNDLLILYRAVHATTYQPSKTLTNRIKSRLDTRQRRNIYRDVMEAVQDQYNPSILIPVDASQQKPSERIFPMSFDVPLTEMKLLELHEKTIKALDKYKPKRRDSAKKFAVARKLQVEYLASLAGYRMILTHAKEIALKGESASSGTIRLLAHMPNALQLFLNEIPSRIDLLNDIIKGREVFSNIGAVDKSSSLTRFMAAKDDNEQKTLVWGVLTDANDVMHISLRDFRPHVAMLHAIDEHELAQQITQEYLDSYVDGLNTYIQELYRIAQISDFEYTVM